MTECNIVVSKKKVDEVVCDMLVVFAVQGKKKRPVYDRGCDRLLPSAAGEFSGEQGQKVLLYAPYAQGENDGIFAASKRILMVGLGGNSSAVPGYETAESLRGAGGLIAQVCRDKKIQKVAIKLPAVTTVDEKLFSEHLLTGLILGTYRFLKYKMDSDQGYKGLAKISLHGAGKISVVRKSIDRARESANAACIARDMANEPGNGWTPKHFAEYGKSLAREQKMHCSVLEKEDMVKLGMGGILAVNRGSHEDPKLVIVEYRPGSYTDTVLLVGKGLTFDSGGISLKPAQKMMDMKYDMCGGAAVISAMGAIARERPAVRVVCMVPSTDNMNGGGAVKPGDIITHYGGITSEIENTDAEGRLILADALAYGIEKFQPDCVVDLATLTGAVILALGHHHSGLLCNNELLTRNLLEAGRLAGEPLWRLPLGADYAKQLESTVADIKNTGGRPGGAITAAEYLHRFVGKTPWAHLDIAGTAWDYTDKSYIPKGPSGIGTRTLIEFIRRWQHGAFKK